MKSGLRWIASVLVKLRDVLDRAPACDVPVFVSAKNAIQETGFTKQSYMSTMERRDWPADRQVLSRERALRRLFPCCRMRQQILNQVVRQAAIEW